MFQRKSHAAQDDTTIYAPPSDDVSAPDLYIPLMSVITYVLLVGLAHGISNRFVPEVLYATMLSAITTIIIESLLLKLSLYLFTTVKSVAFLDLVAYSGYVFVGYAMLLDAMHRLATIDSDPLCHGANMPPSWPLCTLELLQMYLPTSSLVTMAIG
jgi:protein transport protein YIF1